VIAAALAALLTSSCSNFDFDKARQSDGKYDLQALIAAEKAAEGDAGLAAVSWIPLVHFDAALFEKRGEDALAFAFASSYPAGYELTEVSAWGPLFAYGHARSSHYDPEGEGYEIQETRALLWKLWTRHRSVVKTVQGTREEVRDEFLIFGGEPRVRYSPEGDLTPPRSTR
jgi:hypothetical protein